MRSQPSTTTAAESAGRHLRVIGSEVSPTTTADAPLIERSVELWVMRAALDARTAGRRRRHRPRRRGGPGKTALLEQAANAAADAGCLVRHAAPGPLERHFPYGVVRALLEAPVRDAGDERRARLLDGAAAPAGALLLDGTVPSHDATMMPPTASCRWLGNADEQPLVLRRRRTRSGRPLVAAGLAYLARRVEDLRAC